METVRWTLREGGTGKAAGRWATLLGLMALGAACQSTGAETGLATADERTAASLAATCAACHGSQGRSASPDLAGLAGLPADFLAPRLAAFRSDEGSDHVMHQLLNGYTDDEIARLVEWFANQSAEGGASR